MKTLTRVALFSLILLGFALRLQYLIHSHPFFDEYITVLAARETLRHGWPLLPSGLFYEHGLLATYLITPFTALFINTPLPEWQAAQWQLMPARWPSLLLSTVTIPLIYHLGRRTLSSPSAALFAAALFTLSPEGVIWGGRARMYALATLLILLIVYFAYRGFIGPIFSEKQRLPSLYRGQYIWLALLILAAALLTQFGILLMIPPLLLSLLLIFRLHHGRWPGLTLSRLTHLLTLGGIITLAIYIKRLGQPLGAPRLDSPAAGNLLTELLSTITYQITVHFTWADTVTFLARMFGPSHLYTLTMLTLLAFFVNLSVWLGHRFQNRAEGGHKKTSLPPGGIEGGHKKPSLPLGGTEGGHKKTSLPPGGIEGGHKKTSLPLGGIEGGHPWPLPPFVLYCGLIFSLIILLTLTLLEPFRRNIRYFAMYLPLLYLLTAATLERLLRHLQPIAVRHSVTALLLTALLLLTLPDLRLAFRTPEPAYERAFAHLRAAWQPGDALLTMNIPAAALYMGHAEGFAIELDATQFLLQRPDGPVDRWLGVPWLGSVAEFNRILNNRQRVWFVSDTIRQPVYYSGSWQALLNSQMEQVWTHDNALIYRTRPHRHPLPEQPAVSLNHTLAEKLTLTGYTLETTAQTIRLTLFWQPLADMSVDYTTFLHLRALSGETMLQQDGQPLNGQYPTSHWRPGETVIDPLTLPLPPNLPPGDYQLFVGMYDLATMHRLPVTPDPSGENAIILGEVTLP